MTQKCHCELGEQGDGDDASKPFAAPSSTLAIIMCN